MTREFPKDFVFGASTAAYQIEGAWNLDGKGESIWDRFSHTPGKVANGNTGDVACDHYHRYAEDLDLAAAANMSAYRFSLNWSRILPDGVGRVNGAGLDFYERLIEACLARGLSPWPCFYHWDYAQILQDRGGWANRDSVAWYLEFVDVVTRRFADRVTHLVLFNEPSMFTALGYLWGTHAPGLRDESLYGAAVHHVSLATGAGAALVKQIAPRAQVGTVLAINQAYPASDTPADRAACARVDAILNGGFLDPLFGEPYPEPLRAVVAPYVHNGDMAQLQAPLDFIGVNTYTRSAVKAQGDGAEPLSAPPGFTPLDRSLKRTTMNWAIDPLAIYESLARVAGKPKRLPIYVTENGGSFEDVVGTDGRVRDADRIALLDGYLEQVARARADGIDVRGYLIWSLLDNFEWAHGYDRRFGLIHVDYDTLKRTPKDSYHWYAEVARRHSLPPR
jgi:beta-glucosidase